MPLSCASLPAFSCHVRLYQHSLVMCVTTNFLLSCASLSVICAVYGPRTQLIDSSAPADCGLAWLPSKTLVNVHFRLYHPLWVRWQGVWWGGRGAVCEVLYCMYRCDLTMPTYECMQIGGVVTPHDGGCYLKARNDSILWRSFLSTPIAQYQYTKSITMVRVDDMGCLA